MFKSFAMAAMGVLASAAFSSSAFAGLITWDLHQQIAPNSHEQTISSTNGFLNLTYSAWSSTNSGASYDPAQLTDNSAGTGVLGGAFNGIDNDGASGSHIEYVAIEVPSGGWLDVTLVRMRPISTRQQF